MFKSSDPNTFTRYFSLYTPDNTTELGYLIADYKVLRYDDVKVQDIASVNQAKARDFMVHCTQRIILYNSDGIDINPTANNNEYTNYPALINTKLHINTDAPDQISIDLLDYSPKTVNTSVQVSGTNGDSSGKTSGSTSSNTVGSSTSQTNSFGASVSVGLNELNDSASFHYDHSSTTSHDQSHTNSKESSSSNTHDSSESASMSVKDWGAYALANPTNQSPMWLFGQEYPWSAIDNRKINGSNTNPNNPSQVELVMPSDVTLRLYDQVSLQPPSQLSMFGINFVTKSLWQVSLNDNASDSITMDHFIGYFSASHALVKDMVSVYMDKLPVSLVDKQSGDLSTKVNLPIMALDVVGSPSKPPVVGFIPNKFTVQPSPTGNNVAATPFKIVANSNTLIIQDTTSYPEKPTTEAGFTCSEASLTGKFSKETPSLNMTLYFKVVDTSNDYSLNMKHWKLPASDIKLTFIVNDDTSNPIVKYVDAIEAEGGENNLLSFSLRDQSYATIDYSDYLQLGLNSIEVKIEPADTSQLEESGYQIRALAIS